MTEEEQEIERTRRYLYKTLSPARLKELLPTWSTEMQAWVKSFEEKRK